MLQWPKVGPEPGKELLGLHSNDKASGNLRIISLVPQHKRSWKKGTGLHSKEKSYEPILEYEINTYKGDGVHTRSYAS